MERNSKTILHCPYFFLLLARFIYLKIFEFDWFSPNSPRISTALPSVCNICIPIYWQSRQWYLLCRDIPTNISPSKINCWRLSTSLLLSGYLSSMTTIFIWVLLWNILSPHICHLSESYQELPIKVNSRILSWGWTAEFEELINSQVCWGTLF